MPMHVTAISKHPIKSTDGWLVWCTCGWAVHVDTWPDAISRTEGHVEHEGTTDWE